MISKTQIKQMVDDIIERAVFTAMWVEIFKDRPEVLIKHIKNFRKKEIENIMRSMGHAAEDGQLKQTLKEHGMEVDLKEDANALYTVLNNCFDEQENAIKEILNYYEG